MSRNTEKYLEKLEKRLEKKKERNIGKLNKFLNGSSINDDSSISEISFPIWSLQRVNTAEECMTFGSRLSGEISYARKCKHKIHEICGRSYITRWKEFKRHLEYNTVESAYKLIPRFGVCYYQRTYNDWAVEQNCLILLRFYGERKRLQRQILSSRNILTENLPIELVLLIVPLICKAARPEYVEYKLSN